MVFEEYPKWQYALKNTPNSSMDDRSHRTGPTRHARNYYHIELQPTWRLPSILMTQWELSQGVGPCNFEILDL